MLDAKMVLKTHLFIKNSDEASVKKARKQNIFDE